MASNNIQVYILSGVDTSLVGLDIDGWIVKKAHKMRTCDDDYIANTNLYSCFEQILGGGGLLYEQLYKHDEENPFYIYLRKDGVDPFSISPVMDALRTFKCSRIGVYCPISFNNLGGCIVNAFPAYGYLVTPYHEELPLFFLNESEKEELIHYYANVNKSLPYIKNMVSLFHESFRVENDDVRFIMRITILEMLIDGNAELSYRLSRSIAVLLGKTQDESSEIFSTCKNMYNARSKYLHNGDSDKITKEYSVKALEYSRRMIANLITIQQSINEIRKQLDSGGYGSNPFNIKF